MRQHNSFSYDMYVYYCNVYNVFCNLYCCLALLHTFPCSLFTHTLGIYAWDCVSSWENLQLRILSLNLNEIVLYCVISAQMLLCLPYFTITNKAYCFHSNKWDLISYKFTWGQTDVVSPLSAHRLYLYIN